MTEKNFQPFEIFEASKAFLTTPQKFFPAGYVFERYAEMARHITQAQINYCQTLMRANAALLGACYQPRAMAETAESKEVRPSVAARQPEFSSP